MFYEEIIWHLPYWLVYRSKRWNFSHEWIFRLTHLTTSQSAWKRIFLTKRLHPTVFIGVGWHFQQNDCTEKVTYLGQPRISHKEIEKERRPWLQIFVQKCGYYLLLHNDNNNNILPWMHREFNTKIKTRIFTTVKK